MEYIIDLDRHWNSVEKWFNNVNINDNIFSNNYKKVTKEVKSKFTIKSLFLIKSIFNINDINTLDKIILKDYDLDIIFNNVFNNNNLYYLDDDIELKNIIIYCCKFNDYFLDIKNKIIEIIKPIFDDDNFEKILNKDDDLSRFAPIFALLVFLYIKKKNIKKVLEDFISLNIIFIQFFIISYLILDNIMDQTDKNDKNNMIFFKWFMNIVKNPNQEIILNEYELLIWQCITFKKYFLLFREEYPYEDNIFIYNYVKIMIDILNKSHKIQKNNNSVTEREVLEITFKKSYIVILFVVFISFKQLNYKLTKKDIKLLSKVSFLIQLCDDFIDIDKDLIEYNYTYFNIDNKNNILNENNDKIDDKLDNKLDYKIKKIISVFYKFMDELNEKNKNISNIYHYFIKNLLITILYLHSDKVNKELLDNFYEYSMFTPNILRYFDNKTYNIYNDNLFVNFIKKMIKNL